MSLLEGLPLSTDLRGAREGDLVRPCEESRKGTVFLNIYDLLRVVLRFSSQAH